MMNYIMDVMPAKCKNDARSLKQVSDAVAIPLKSWLQLAPRLTHVKPTRFVPRLRRILSANETELVCMLCHPLVRVR